MRLVHIYTAVEEFVGRKGRQNSKTGNSIAYSLFGHEDARAAEDRDLPANALPVSTSKSSGISRAVVWPGA